jgi:hypothetical protein
MVAHEAVRMDDGVITFCGRSQKGEKLFSIFPASEYVFSFVAPRGDVVESARIFYSEWTRHLFSPMNNPWRFYIRIARPLSNV